MGNDAAALQLQWFEAQSVNSVGFLWHLVWTTLFHDIFNSTPECFDWECSPLMKACKTKFDWASSYHTQDCMLSFLCWTRNTYWVNCLPVVFRLFSFFSRFETLRIIATQGKNATVIVPDRIDPESALRVTGNGSSGSWIFSNDKQIDLEKHWVENAISISVECWTGRCFCNGAHLCLPLDQCLCLY